MSRLDPVRIPVSAFRPRLWASVRLAGWAVLFGAMLSGAPAGAAPPALAPYVIPLDMHPASDLPNGTPSAAPQGLPAMPQIVRPGGGDASQVTIAPPAPNPKGGESPDVLPIADRGGSGFFVGGEGTVLTAAHVVDGCRRLQIVSNIVGRTWVSVLALDGGRDLALLRTPGIRAPAVLRLAASPPVSPRLRVLGYPASAGEGAAAETWGVPINARFPPSIGPLANPRETLWLSAPEVKHGFSGGPIFDPKLGAVVGMVKGAVDAGYLRLVRDVPTSGVAMGPGVGEIGSFLRREAGATVSLASAGEGEETARRATVRVLCWQ